MLRLDKAEEWCRSRDCQLIIDYVKDILNTESGKGKILINAKCACEKELSVFDVTAEHCLRQRGFLQRNSIWRVH